MIGNLLEFVKAMISAYYAYLDGFYFSRNTHRNQDGSSWGFYRINHRSGIYSLADFDFDNSSRHRYFSVNSEKQHYELKR